MDIVGYGVTPVWDMAGPTTFEYDGIRKAGTSIITGLLPAHVVYNQTRTASAPGRVSAPAIRGRRSWTSTP